MMRRQRKREYRKTFTHTVFSAAELFQLVIYFSTIANT